MASRLIQRLEQQIAQCDDPLALECLKAERIGVLARHGLLDEARAGLQSVRQQNQRLRRVRLAGWIALVEGLIDHFESLAPSAALHFEQAYKHAVRARDVEVQALAMAWLSISSLNASALEAFASQIAQAIHLARPEHHAVWARIGLVLGDTYRFAGDEPSALRWYARARQAAAMEGDASMMSAFLHNQSAMRSASIGLDDATGQCDADAAQRALLEAESSANYDGGAGSAALQAMMPVVRAQLLVVLGRFEEALGLYDAHLRQASAQGLAYREARFLADRAWCLYNLAQPEAARLDAQRALCALSALYDADDRAAVHGRLAQVFAGLGEAASAAEQRQWAQTALAEHRAEQARWRHALGAALGGV